MSPARLALAVTVGLCLACGGFTAAGDASLREQWRAKFMEGCDQPGRDATDMCTCVADKAIAELPPEALLDGPRLERFVAEVALPACGEPETDVEGDSE